MILVLAASSISTVVWSSTIFARAGRDHSELAATVYHELRPFSLPAVFVQFVTAVVLSGGGPGFEPGFWLILNVIVWWSIVHRDGGDDDRWRRRRRKAAAKVRALASGRLVAEPA